VAETLKGDFRDAAASLPPGPTMLSRGESWVPGFMQRMFRGAGGDVSRGDIPPASPHDYGVPSGSARSPVRVSAQRARLFGASCDGRGPSACDAGIGGRGGRGRGLGRGYIRASEQRCALGWILHQFLCIDESMIRCNSRWCSFLQSMLRKPIKRGIKVFCLADAVSNYLFSWDVYTAPLGWTVHNLVCGTLLPADFDNNDHVLVVDNYFVGVKLFVDLAKRAIYAVGTSKLVRPANVTDGSWPFQTYAKTLMERVDRGWRRIARYVIPGMETDDHTIQASVWRDNKFVQMLSICFNVDDPVRVRRWDGSSADRSWYSGLLPHYIYQKYMAAIDRIDRVIANLRLGLHHCQRRFQRSVFFWQSSGITNNSFVQLEAVMPAELYANVKKHFDGGSSVGFTNWLQINLGLVLIQEGNGAGADALSDEDEAAGKAPHWVPGVKGRKPADGGILGRPPQPVDHVYRPDCFERGLCAGCWSVAEVKDEEAAKKGGGLGQETPGKSNIRKTKGGCEGCNARICVKCIDRWCHLTRQRLPADASLPHGGVHPGLPCVEVCGRMRFAPGVLSTPPGLAAARGSGHDDGTGDASPAGSGSDCESDDDIESEDQQHSDRASPARRRQRTTRSGVADGEEVVEGGAFLKSSSAQARKSSSAQARRQKRRRQ